jgi:hypothetical protein
MVGSVASNAVSMWHGVTEVDFGSHQVEKNTKRSNGMQSHMDNTEIVQLQSVEEQQEESSRSSVLGGKCRHRDSTTLSPRKTKAAEHVEKQQYEKQVSGRVLLTGFLRLGQPRQRSATKSTESK